MNGEIWLDETYNSGVEGCPGCRFIIRLNAPLMPLDLITCESSSMGRAGLSIDEMETKRPQELPKDLSILFVDDVAVLRKLFSRAIRRIQPDWRLEEAADGETALQLVESHDFDLIFMDQYMTSDENKKLLGTETVSAMRAKGVKSVICGLSANDVEQPFMEAGANFFKLKPHPIASEELTHLLLRILYGDVED
jgi:CheY-like chemotaxis protein